MSLYLAGSLSQSPTTLAWIKKNFLNAGVLFPIANLCNFWQSGVSSVINLAIINAAYSVLFPMICAQIGEENMEQFRQYIKLRDGEGNNVKAAFKSTKDFVRNIPSLVGSAFRFVCRELTNPLRVSSYTTLASGVVMLALAFMGVGPCLYPGISAMVFGVGNYIQSSENIKKMVYNTFHKAMKHPAIWYGLGYAATAIGIGGGIATLLNPALAPVAFGLTAFSLLATSTSAIGMVTGKINNPAVPFMLVAFGTAAFAVTGFMSGNIVGGLTGTFACAGEISLAIQMYKDHLIKTNNLNANPRNDGTWGGRFEDTMTAPIRWAMKLGWLEKPQPAAVPA